MSYNGYTDYATWRVMSDLFSNIEFTEPGDNKYIFSLVFDNITKSKESENSISQHISETFEKVMDALVFELYFPEEFKKANVQIYEHAKAIFKPIDDLEEEAQKQLILDTYHTLNEKKNPLRNQIKLMKIELKQLLLPILSI